VFAWLLFESYGNPRFANAPERVRDMGYVLEVLAQWDVAWFLGIAREGYSYAEGSVAYFPLYPVVVGVVGRVLAGHYVLAGVAVSLAACAVAFVLLDHLARLKLGDEVARRSVLYLAVFPTSLFLGLPYSESLYLALSVGAFLAIERGSLPASGVIAGLAMLTRTAGFALLPALLLLAWRAGHRRRMAWLLVAPAIAALYPLYLWRTEGSPFAFLDAQRTGWGRELSELGPLEGVGRGLNAGWQGIHQVIAGPDAAGLYWNWARDTTPGRAAMLSIFYALTLLLLLLLTVIAWKRLGAPYGLFCALSLALPLSSPTTDWPLLSLPRFALGMFPVFIALGSLRVSPERHRILLATSTLLLGVVVCQWATYYFVA
jgi:hypothetical protein